MNKSEYVSRNVMDKYHDKFTRKLTALRAEVRALRVEIKDYTRIVQAMRDRLVFGPDADAWKTLVESVMEESAEL